MGCYYDLGGCVDPMTIRIGSNTTFKTAQTFLTPFYNNMYFFGLNHFIIYHERNDLDFSAPSYSDPSIQMRFSVTGSSGNDIYSTDLTFTGNPYQLFTLSFGYIIDVSSDCPTSGDIYHINSYQCDTFCPAGAYINATDKYCYPCGIRCYTCRGLRICNASAVRQVPSTESSVEHNAYVKHFTTMIILYLISVLIVPILV